MAAPAIVQHELPLTLNLQPRNVRRQVRGVDAVVTAEPEVIRAPEKFQQFANAALWNSAAGPRLSKSVVSELTLARTRAIRLKISENSQIGLALCVFALARSSFAHQPARASLADRAPAQDGDLLAWCMSQPLAELEEMLAILVAECIDLTHGGVSPEDRRLQALGD